ncbi:hypothetical protein GYMLUDRAFT_246963 [Collybiopsis luxurians FD-317 M1]|uniref:Uncharacterized protein n=1 Tax=Collybiopsis luxurians FD-317 M1 TaxID=944289 RepID=A0A0D0B329_9AGAR|nr:hypothetical protein GYMLUDRAFT_246963 [Collybiopsis luxurians FD-317 M1]
MSFNPNSLLNLLVFSKDCQLASISNWAAFCDHLKSVAHSTGLLGYLNSSIQAPIAPTPIIGAAAPAVVALPVPTVPTPINSHSPSGEEWELRDGHLASIIYQNIKDPRSIGVMEDMSSNAMWRKLTGKYKTNSAAAQALAKEHIQQFKYTLGTPFEDYFKQLKVLCKAANNVGCSAQDEDLHTRFLTSLSTDYLWILQTHSACPYSDLKCTLLEYNMMVESANTINLATTVPNEKTLTCIVNYQDGIHIDKLHGVISQELQNVLVVFEVSGKTPNKWEDYLELLLMAYKALHPEKSKSVIFGTSNNKGNSSNDPNATEIDMAKRSKGKAPEQANSQEPKCKYCQICTGKGMKSKAKTHNTVDCWDKPGNEDKRPASRPSSLSSPLTTGQGNTKGQPTQGAKKSFKARLLEIFDEMDNNEPVPPAAALNANSMSITEIVPPGLAGKGAAA